MSAREQQAFEFCQKQDYESAYPFLLQAADERSSWAASFLGWMFEYGHYVEKNSEEALKYYLLASADGDPDALYRLGLLLVDMKRYLDAEKIFQTGMETGHLGCQYNYGWLLFKSAENESNKSLGERLVQDAASKGHLFAKRKLISIQLRQNRTILGQIKAALQIFALSFAVFREGARDQYSLRIH